MQISNRNHPSEESHLHKPLSFQNTPNADGAPLATPPTPLPMPNCIIQTREHHPWFIIMTLIPSRACCASKALPASVSGYVDVTSGLRSTSLRETRLMASA